MLRALLCLLACANAALYTVESQHFAAAGVGDGMVVVSTYTQLMPGIAGALFFKYLEAHLNAAFINESFSIAFQPFWNSSDDLLRQAKLDQRTLAAV